MRTLVSTESRVLDIMNASIRDSQGNSIASINAEALRDLYRLRVVWAQVVVIADYGY